MKTENSGNPIQPAGGSPSRGSFPFAMLKGALIGVGAILPGINCGVLCVVLAISPPLMDLMAHPLRGLKKNFLNFLPIVLGLALGVLGVTKLLQWVLAEFETVAVWLFVGLIVGMLPSLWKEAGKNGRRQRDLAAGGVTFALMLVCKDELAHMDIRKIGLEHIQEYINRLEADLSASTIKKQKLKLMLSQVLDHAILTGVIQRNPVQGVQMPPMTHNTKVVFPYEKEEQEKLVAAFTEEKGNKLRLRYGWGAVLILETGLRAGEALALEWNDIDEEKRTLRVNKNMVRVDGKNVVQRTTKTASGKRTIPLNSKAMEAIQHLKKQQAMGCAYVFATQTGEHVSYRHILTTMERACEAAGVEHRGLHAPRHSFASNLYARGVEVKIISKLLGHASVEITYNRYIHFFEGDIDDTFRQAVGV